MMGNRSNGCWRLLQGIPWHLWDELFVTHADVRVLSKSTESGGFQTIGKSPLSRKQAIA